MNIIERIKNNSGPVIIAEIGVNHEGSLEKAKELMVLAKKAGADAVKFQSYTINRYIEASNAERIKRLQKFYLGEEDFYELFEFSKQLKIGFLSTPVTEDWVEKLAPICTEYKIASADLTFKPLIDCIIKTNKPIILSTGGANLAEIDETVRWIKNKLVNVPLDERLVLLHCISSYPAPLEEANLNSIPFLRDRYNVYIGYSNHVKGVDTCLASVALGASIIEVHFTDNKENREFRDHALSFDYNDLKLFVEKSKIYSKALGKYGKYVQPSEQEGLTLFRKGIVAACSLDKGKTLSKEDMLYARPAIEFKANELESLIGKKLKQSVKKGELIPRDAIQCVE